MATAPPTLPAAAPPAPPEMVDWIDEQGRTLESLSRAEIRRRNLLHRVTATFVFHADGRLFVQQRSPAKDVYPGLFDMCVGGTVASGEGYAENACREVAEELGVHGVPLYELFGHRFQDAHSCSLIRVFACVYAGPLRLQPEEVVDGRWCAEAEVERLIAAGRMCPDSTQGWRTYLATHGAGRNFALEVAPGLAPIDCSAWRTRP
jgi:isopentenyldiphosphate isomerase